MVRYPRYNAQELRSMLCGSDTNVLRREKAYNIVAGNRLEPEIYTLTKGEAKAAIRIAEQNELLVGCILRHFKDVDSGKIDPTLDDADMYPFARQLIDVINFEDGPIASIFRLLIIEIVSSYIIQNAARYEEVQI